MGSLIVESGSKKRLLRSAIHDPQSLFIFVHFDVGCSSPLIQGFDNQLVAV
jgi:hypothetical protein